MTKGILYGLTRVVDVDLSGYFDNIRHHKLLEKVARRVQDDDISKGYDNLDFIRSADDMVMLVHWHPKEDWLLQKVQKRLKEELDRLEVEMNLEKTKVVDLKKGGSFSFLGFDIRLNCNRKGKTYVSKTPRKKKRIEIGKRVRAVLKTNRNNPLKEVIQAVNGVIRGWVNYFRIGNSSSAFSKVRNDIEKKVRRFVMKRKKRKGFGWKLWSREEIYQKWGLYNDYRIQYLILKAAPSR